MTEQDEKPISVLGGAVIGREMKARQASVHPVVDETRTTGGGNGGPIGRALITRGCLCGLEIVKWLAFLSPPADHQQTAAACACAGITVLIDIDVAPCWVNNCVQRFQCCNRNGIPLLLHHIAFPFLQLLVTCITIFF